MLATCTPPRGPARHKMMALTHILIAAALAAPCMVSATAFKACGKWHQNLNIDAVHLETVTKPDTHWCSKACMQKHGCKAATFKKEGNECKLYWTTRYSLSYEEEGTFAHVLCEEDCDNVDENEFYDEGEQLDRFRIKDIWWCRKRCTMNDKCNGINWRRASKECTLKHFIPGGVRKVGNRSVDSLIFCDKYAPLPVCKKGDIAYLGVCDSPEEECGGKDQPLCQEGEQCQSGLSTTHEGICQCGNLWQSCCNGKCGSGMACDTNGNKNGQCTPCGGDAHNDYQKCCPNPDGGDRGVCNQSDDKRRMCMSSGSCAPCGGQWQPLCDSDPPCKGMLMPDPHKGIQCVMAGSD